MFHEVHLQIIIVTGWKILNYKIKHITDNHFIILTQYTQIYFDSFISPPSNAKNVLSTVELTTFHKKAI